MKVLFGFRFYFLLVAVVIGMGLSVLPSFAEENPGKPEAKARSKVEQEATFIQIYSWATILPKELIDLQSDLNRDKGYKAVQSKLAAFAEEVDMLRKEATIAKKDPNLQLRQVTKCQNEVYKIDIRLKKLSESITATISDLSARRLEWQKKKDQIVKYKNKELLSLALSEEQKKTLLETIEKALQLIEEQLKLVLVVGKQIGDLQVQVYSVDSLLDKMEKELKAYSFKRTSPSILSPKYYAGINSDLLRQSYVNTRTFFADLLETNRVKDNLTLILLGLFVFFLVSFLIYKTRTLIPPSSNWYPFASHPLATTVFMATSINTLVGAIPAISFDLSQRGKALLHILVLFASIFLTSRLVLKKKLRRLLVILIIFILVAFLMVVLDFPQAVIVLYVFYVSLLALVYYFYQLPGARKKTGFSGTFRRISGIFPLGALLLGFFGYDKVAVMLFLALFSAVVACLIVWILYLLHLGLLDLLLSVIPLNLIREQRETILKSLKPIIASIHVVLLFAFQVVIFNLYPNVSEALDKIVVAGFKVLGFQVSPGFILTVVFVIYGSILLSRGLQMLLLNKILPSYGAEKGVQLSITRLAHYAVLTLGFFFMLKILGFELDQLALLGGALGVGIAFGLQAIVNNFASGLILLFERPVKVGDTVQIGTEIGEVKNLGLRATIIQTFDNAEIVVPNSDLITGQVTNWTLAERKVRVRVPVGVAYGTDIAKVLEILLACGNANPMVLSNPPAKAFFLAFGASSLDFELRVWILEYLDKIQVLSDLNQDIENEFSMNNVEIPFPQTDLHLRSVDEAAATSMRGGCSSIQNGVTSSTSPDSSKDNG
jgi:potassium-dependent mechanosensitive channel